MVKVNQVKVMHVLLGIILLFMLTGCGADQNAKATVVTPSETSDSQVNQSDEASAQTASKVSVETSTENQSTPVITPLSTKFDIEFKYQNNVYQYNLESKWSNVEIKAAPVTHVNGLELLLDGTSHMFSDCDLNHSGEITSDEWESYEDEIFFSVIDYGSDGKVGLEEFELFTSQLSGIYLMADQYSISEPKNQDYAISLEDGCSPVSIKLLRAGKGGFKAGAGTVFQEGTVFVELASEFDIYLKQMPEMEVGVGFEAPMLSMFLEQDYEANNHGALGFSSIVNASEFNAIYNGVPFILHYEGVGESGVLDVYDLKITPRN